jgi:hypothetical protein
MFFEINIILLVVVVWIVDDLKWALIHFGAIYSKTQTSGLSFYGIVHYGDMETQIIKH